MRPRVPHPRRSSKRGPSFAAVAIACALVLGSFAGSGVPIAHAQGAVEVAAAELVDLVLAAARDEALRERLALAGETGVVHPRRESVEVDHRFPTSCSRYSANFSRAAAMRFGRCCVGQRSSLGR